MPRKTQQSLFDVPDWIPVDAWTAYREMRQKIKKPMTEYAVKLAIDKLWELREQGHEPRAVLEQSIFNSWQGLFEPRNDNGNRKATAAATRTSRNIQAIIQSSVGGGVQRVHVPNERAVQPRTPSGSSGNGTQGSIPAGEDVARRAGRPDTDSDT